MIKFVLMVNRQGQTRLSRYYQPVELSRRAQLEADVVRCCLGRAKEQVTCQGRPAHRGSAPVIKLLSSKNISNVKSNLGSLLNYETNIKVSFGLQCLMLMVCSIRSSGATRDVPQVCVHSGSLLKAVVLPVFLCGVQRLQAGLSPVCCPLHRGWHQRQRGEVRPGKGPVSAVDWLTSSKHQKQLGRHLAVFLNAFFTERAGRLRAGP